MIFIGIDPGVKVGFATWSTLSQTLSAKTITIWELYEELKFYSETAVKKDILVVIEDARMRGGRKSAAMGAGWVRTLSGQIEKLCKKLGLNYELIRPGSTMTKCPPERFTVITGMQSKSRGGKIIVSEHARDAALMVFGRK